MRRVYHVTVAVDVTAKTEAEFRAAVEDLLHEAPFRDVTSVGDFGCYSARSRQRAVSVRKAPKGAAR